MLLTDCPSTLLILSIHHQRHRPKRAQGNFRPPVHLRLTCITLACNEHQLLQPLHMICQARRWDSNAESFRTQNFNYNFDDENDEDTEDDDSSEEWDEVLEDYIDSIWIFKVLGTYGWALPFILVSMLLATGPKAFLMALALPLGQSTLSFALEKISGRKKKRRKLKNKTKTSRTVNLGKEKRGRNHQGNKKPKMGYQSWVPSFDDSTHDPVKKDETTFNGWDQQDEENEFQLGSSTYSGKSHKSASEKSRLGTRLRKSETPLLLRLLIGVFPFLGSWTKMF